MTEAWVTGASGFIGRYAARELQRRGFTVHGIGYGPWPEPERQRWGVSTWVNGAVTVAGLDVLARAAGRPSVILHLAGGSSVGESILAPNEDFHRTVTATAELAEWVRSRAPQARIVAASSAAVYGDAWSSPIPVAAALRPCSPYGAHKVAMESILAGYARTYGTAVAIVRLFSVYGPGLEKQIIWELCVRLASGARSLVLGGTGNETRDFVYVTDAAHLLVSAVESANPEVAAWNGATGRSVFVRTVAEQVVRCWGGSVQIQFDGQSRKGDPPHLIADVEGNAAIAPPAWTNLEVGVEQTVAAARLRLLSTRS